MIKLLCILFLFFVNSSFGQKMSDNTIIINGFVGYKQIHDKLVNEGYSTTNTDTSLILTTIKFTRWIGETCFSIKRTDTSVIIKGYCPDFSFKEFKKMGIIAKSFELPVTFFNTKR